MSDSPTIDANFLRAKSKLQRGTDFRDTVDVDIGDTSVTYGYRLLTDAEMGRVKPTLPLEEFADSSTDSLDDDDRARLEALRDKDREQMTDDEVDELRDLAQSSSVMDLLDALDQEARAKIRWAGRQAILPAPEDVRAIMNADFEQKAQVLGRDVANANSEQAVETALADQIRDDITDQPFPIAKQVGLVTILETMQVQGNGFEE